MSEPTIEEIEAEAHRWQYSQDRTVQYGLERILILDRIPWLLAEVESLRRAAKQMSDIHIDDAYMRVAREAYHDQVLCDKERNK